MGNAWNKPQWIKPEFLDEQWLKPEFLDEQLLGVGAMGYKEGI